MPAATSGSTPYMGSTGFPASPGVKRLTTTSESTAVKDVAGLLTCAYASNTGTSVQYLQFWNVMSSDVTLGTTLPYITLPIPVTALGGTTILQFTPQAPIEFTTAIAAAVTTTTSGGTGSTTGLSYATVLFG